MAADQLKTAVWAVWLILSGVIFVILCLPFVYSADSIQAMVPACEWQAKYHEACPVCGMTRSFLSISRGEFTQARLTHGLSLYLYSLFVLNEIGAALVLIKRSHRTRRRKTLKGRC
jgi:hypothetical protein